MGTTTINVTAGDPVGRVSHLDVNALIARVTRDHLGFLTTGDVARLAGDDNGRLVQVLVRCGGCRFICAAQDVAHLSDAVRAVGDYVRDVSIRARDN